MCVCVIILTLPPMIQYWYTECSSNPILRLQITMFTGHKNSTQRIDIVGFAEFRIWIRASNDTKSGRNGEQCRHLMLFNDTEILTGVRCSIRFTFVHHTRCTEQQWAVANVWVANDPSWKRDNCILKYRSWNSRRIRDASEFCVKFSLFGACLNRMQTTIHRWVWGHR